MASSEQAETKYSFWSTGCSLTPILLQRADPMIPIIPHLPEPVHPHLAEECSLSHHSQLQVLACNCITVWAFGLRIPTMKVSYAPKSAAYVQTGSKTLSRCLHASTLTKCITEPKLNKPSPSEKTRSSGINHAPIKMFSLNSTDTA